MLLGLILKHFRMPLHANCEPLGGKFNTLGTVVVRPRNSSEAGTQPGNSLVVDGIYGQLGNAKRTG